MERDRVDCVGGIVEDGAGRLLLIRRGTEPSRGAWSIPGGRVEPGESDHDAVVREVAEETGLAVEVTGYAGSVERDAPDGSVYVIRDYLCSPAAGVDLAAVRAATDAADAGWFTAAEVDALDCAPGLLEALRSWDVPALRSST